MTYLFYLIFGNINHLSLVIFISFLGQTYAQDNNQNGIDSVIIQIDKLYRKDSNKALAMLDSIKVIVDKTGKDKQKFNFHLQYYVILPIV